MDKERKDHRDRLIALGFVSVLLIIVYGPAAGFFSGADRFLFDQIAGRMSPPAVPDGVIVSIDARDRPASDLRANYAELIALARGQNARRIILAEPPENAEPAKWAVGDSPVPVYVPARHELASATGRYGYVDIRPDNDGVLRRSSLWFLNGGVMAPSLPLAVALAEPENLPTASIARNDAAMFVSAYTPLPRIAAADLLSGRADPRQLAGKTLFIDSSPPLTANAAQLPSGQYVTLSEAVAMMLGMIEAGRIITVPAWAGVMEILTPAILAVLAVLLLPGHRRVEIVTATLGALVTLMAVQAALLVFGLLRFDLGRPMVVLAGASIVSAWLAGAVRVAANDAFKRGNAFLTAGRLEPAFAEFRRCEPNEMVANAMYKLSLAFEEQAQPERAEAVLNWMKQTQKIENQGSVAAVHKTSNGTPRQLGRYVIEKKIGRGAMGAVYLARDPRINRSVALKVIPIEKEFEDEELKEARLRFFREAESAGRLAHPNIITVYDCGEDQHLAYIAMEYLEGTSLTYFKDPKKLLAPRKALELCARTADALDYAHNQGVIHRDIKPANLLYNAREDVLKISDFGVARLTDNNRTKTGIVLGTPMYMSPEQLSAEPLTGHSDIFSLGVTLYELLTGEVPFKATNIALLMKKITSEDPAPVSNRRPGVPPSVDTVLFKALAKSPADRFANGGEFAMALRNCAKYAST